MIFTPSLSPKDFFSQKLTDASAGRQPDEQFDINYMSVAPIEADKTLKTFKKNWPTFAVKSVASNVVFNLAILLIQI